MGLDIEDAFQVFHSLIFIFLSGEAHCVQTEYADLNLI